MSKKLNIIVLSNHKGGVTKSTTSYVLASLFATDSHKKIYKPNHKRTGTKTLVIDLDSQCNITQSVLTEEQEEAIQGGVFEAITEGNAAPYIIQSETMPNLYILPATKSLSKFEAYHAKHLEDYEGAEKLLENSLIQVIEDLGIENIIIDTAPSSSELMNQALAFCPYPEYNFTNVITPFTLSLYGLNSLAQTSETLNAVSEVINPNLRLLKLLPVLLRKNTKSYKEKLVEAKEIYGELVSNVTILEKVELENITNEGFSEEYSNQRQALTVYYDLFNEIKEVL